jgi:hypothetical protein
MDGFDSQKLKSKMEQLAALGSPWATAAMAYSYLIPDGNETRQVAKAQETCDSLLHRNDAYVLYISAWAELYAGNTNTASKRLQASAKLGFAPAIVDLLNFAINNWLVKDADRNTLVGLAAAARTSGHKAALLYVCQLYVSGRVGQARRIVGIVCLPFAYAKYIAWLRLSPLSEDVFIFRPRARRGLFKQALVVATP